jgi:two-component system, chemotaxis family, chemotaxis protein CheY
MARILVVDDHPLVRKAMRDVLLAAGHDVLEAQNGREAEAAVATGAPDLVLLDIMMPEQDGIETIIALRRTYAGLRILAMSAGGHGRLDFLTAAKTFGADAVLQKPFDGPQLVATIDAVLAAKP